MKLKVRLTNKIPLLAELSKLKIFHVLGGGDLVVELFEFFLHQVLNVRDQSVDVVFAHSSGFHLWQH